MAWLLALALSGCAASTSSPAPRRAGPQLESILEPAGELFSAPQSTLAALRALGVQRVRVDIVWSQLAPDAAAASPPPNFHASDPASYPAAAWAPYDTVFRDAAADGIAVDATIGGPAPAWAEAPGEPTGGFAGVWKPSARAFERFVTAVGRRYGGRFRLAGAAKPLPRIDFWSIWNEPNNGFDLAPQAVQHNRTPVSPHLYRLLLGAAWTALHATGHGSDTILFGETAPRGQVTAGRPGNFSVMEPLLFIRALYCLNSHFLPLAGVAARAAGCPSTAAARARFRAANPALFEASGYADHPYPQGPAPPDERTPRSVPGSSGYADFASLSELEATLDRALAAYGSHRQLPIWSTEFGYHTDPPEPAMTPPELAAYYLNWSEYLSWRNPRLRSYDQYLLRDAADDRFATGLELPNGRRLATFYAFRMPVFVPDTSQPHGGRLLIWGCVRPAWYIPGRQRAALQFAPGASRTFKTIAPIPIADREGYFDFYRHFAVSGHLRIAWRYPRGPLIYSRTVAIVVR